MSIRKQLSVQALSPDQPKCAAAGKLCDGLSCVTRKKLLRVDVEIRIVSGVLGGGASLLALPIVMGCRLVAWSSL